MAIDLDAVESKWLGICGACDAGVGKCTHPSGDYRPVMAELVDELKAVRADRETYWARLERYDGQAWETLFEQRDQAIATVERVKALHCEDDGYCTEDGFPWPCQTACALAGTAEEGSDRD